MEEMAKNIDSIKNNIGWLKHTLSIDRIKKVLFTELHKTSIQKMKQIVWVANDLNRDTVAEHSKLEESRLILGWVRDKFSEVLAERYSNFTDKLEAIMKKLRRLHCF